MNRKMTVLAKMTAVFVVILLIGAGFSGYGVAAEKKVVLKVWDDAVNAGPELLAYVKDFMKKFPNVDVQVTLFEREDYKTQTRLALSSGTGPDVWQINGGEFYLQFVNNGGALDVTEIGKQQKWTDRIDAPVLDLYTVNGKLYGLPIGSSSPWQVLYCNKDFFTKNNIPYPKTVDELIKVSGMIREKGLQPIGFYDKEGWPGQILLGDYMMQLIDPSIQNALNSGKIKWPESKELKIALETMVKMAKAKVFCDGYETMTNDTVMQAWLAGKVAALYIGTWFYNAVEKEGGVKFPVETIPLPLIDENTVLKGTQQYPEPIEMINPQTKVLDTAVAFLEYMSRPEYYVIRGNTMKCLTVSPEANKSIDLPYWLKAEPLMSQSKLPMCNYWTQSFPMPVEEVLSNQIKLVLGGKITAQEALEKIEAEHAKNRK
jgi:raffinose/stachyose/melibiose transport system substrate-binding protein